MTNDDFPCCASGAHEATTNSELRVANAEIARLRGAIAEVFDYVEQSKVAFQYDDDWVHADDIKTILAKATVTGRP